MRKQIIPVGALAVVAIAAFSALSQNRDDGVAEAATATAAVVAADVIVYKSPTCGCCTGWVEHLRESGYDVSTVDIAEYEALAAKKAEHGVPNDLGSCHTAVVDGYTVEGHVPASVIARLLEERPDVRGLAVPGMPPGSPGMESPNPRPYDVIAFRDDGSRTVFESVYPDGAR